MQRYNWYMTEEEELENEGIVLIDGKYYKKIYYWNNWMLDAYFKSKKYFMYPINNKWEKQAL